jgi:iron complex outermembrane recepter protein
MTLGVSRDAGLAAYTRSYALGEFTANRGVEQTLVPVNGVELQGRTVTQSVYANWQIPLHRHWQMSVAARFNDAHVKTDDWLVPALPPPARGLDNDFHYRIVNPALGLSYSTRPGWSAYASVSQGARAPSPVELACADRQAPCLLPNAMASDPYLRPVITRTLEGGVRGLIAALGPAARWYAAWYRADNRDDILFVSARNGAGYFANFGKTRRQGFEVGASGKSGLAEAGVLDWGANYSRNDARFRSRAILLSENNSSKGSVAGLQGNEIEVLPGDRIPGVPLHQIKVWSELLLPATTKIGLELMAFSEEIARGNENNRHRVGTVTNLYGETQTYRAAGSVPGRAIVNLSAGWQPWREWDVFVRVNNLFDRRYFSAAVLGNNAFASGSFERNPDLWQRDLFVAPGAVRTIFAGLRWTPNVSH